MRILIFAFIGAYFLCIQALAAPSDTTAQFDTRTGLFIVKHHTVDIARANFVFWTEKWAWSGVNIATKVNGVLDYGFSGANKESGLSLKASAKRIGNNRIEWRMHIDPGANAYGGLSIKFQLAPFADEAFVPQLDILPGKDGWSLKLSADEEPIRMVIAPAPADVVFERNQRDEVRMYLALPGEKLVSGDYRMTVELPAGSAIVPEPAERLSQPDLSWYNNLLDTSISPVDLSFLNEAEKPAGKHGTVGVKDGQLVFADGALARFWGANITASAIFQTGLGDTVKQAKRLSKLGFNLVRIHHFDSDWVKPNILGSETEAGLELNSEALRSLDWWIKALGDEGIYVEIDLNVGRVMSSTGLDGFEEIVLNNRNPTAKGFAYLNADVEARMKALNALLLKHVNPYTNLSYSDDPRIAFLLVTNENDLTHHFGNMFLPDKQRPKHAQIYMAEALRFAEEKGLDPDLTWRAWQYGPSKLFLSDLEHRFNLRMIADIRSAGSKALVITTSSWGNMTAVGLPSLSDGDVIAVHSYGESGILENDPRYTSNLTSWMAAAGLAGKPLTVPEWNVTEYPSYDRSALPGYIAAIASFQDWSALIEYAYSQSALDETARANQWEMASDPALLGMMPVGALIYRRQDVRPGKTVRYLHPSIDDFINRPVSPSTSRAIRTMTETGRWRMALPPIEQLGWFKPWVLDQNGQTVTDMMADFAGSGDEICAEGGEFCRNWRRGIFTVDTPMTQLVSGWIGGETIALKNATIALKTANAALAIQSLDSKPIVEARSILISMAAQTLPQQGGPTAIRSEPINGQVTFKALPGLTAYASFGDGRRKSIPVRYANGAYSLNLDATLGTYWIVFRDE